MQILIISIIIFHVSEPYNVTKPTFDLSPILTKVIHKGKLRRRSSVIQLSLIIKRLRS